MRNNTNIFKTRLTKPVIFLIIGLYPLISYSQDTILTHYVQEGLKNNEVLKQKLALIDRSNSEYKVAKSYLYPNAVLSSRYSVANGGRTTNVPIYDILKGYSDYNGLTVPPGIENAQINFLRPTESESKIEVTQSVFDMRLIYNTLIKNDLVKISKLNSQIYKRALVAEIKKAYFNYLKAQEIIKLYDNIDNLARENLRVTKLLYDNNKVTIDNIYRADVECSKIGTQKNDAQKNSKTAKAYFNYLLNRPLDSEILQEGQATLDYQPVAGDTLLSTDDSKREEIAQLKENIEIQDKNVKIQKSNLLPTVLVDLNYGYQGDKYEFGKDNDFILASVIIRWNIFSGFQKKAKIQQSKIDKLVAESQYSDYKEKLQLEISNAYFDLEAADKAIDYNRESVKSAKVYFKLMDKKYQQGMATQVEFLDAMSNMQKAEESLIISIYDYYIKYSDYEKVTASYPLPEQE